MATNPAEIAIVDNNNDDDVENDDDDDVMLIDGINENELLCRAKEIVLERTHDWTIIRSNNHDGTSGEDGSVASAEDRVPRLGRDGKFMIYSRHYWALFWGLFTEIQIHAVLKTHAHFLYLLVSLLSLSLSRTHTHTHTHAHTLEITIGKLLGSGGFFNVSEIKAITLRRHTSNRAGDDGGTGEDDNSTQPEDDEDDNSNFKNIVNEMKKKDLLTDEEDYINTVVQDRKFMSKHYIRGKNKDCRYAIKIMRPECRDDADKYINTVVDLVIEAKFLSVVRHPNIIKIRAISDNGLFSSSGGGQSSSFIILDRLYGTLTEKLDYWSKKENSISLSKLFDFQKKKEKHYFAKRLTVAYDVASALSYLHDLR